MSDYAVISQTTFGKTGGATSIGEAPIKGLIDPSDGESHVGGILD